MWLERRTHYEIIGPLFGNEVVVWVMVYGSLIFDLTVVWLLLYHRTRIAAFVVATGFHVLNARLWGLFIFPWLMTAATTIFFPPDWPLRVRDRLAGLWTQAGVQTSHDEPKPRSQSGAIPMKMAPPLVVLLAAWVLVQVVVPFRHFVNPGSVHWTEQGHRFAWHMMLREKSGTAVFIVMKAGEEVIIEPAEYLGERQAARIVGHPERLVRFARHLSDLHEGAEVRVETWVSLNGRTPAPLIDPDVDLSSVSMPRWGRADWILPLSGPLR